MKVKHNIIKREQVKPLLFNLYGKIFGVRHIGVGYEDSKVFDLNKLIDKIDNILKNDMFY